MSISDTLASSDTAAIAKTREAWLAAVNSDNVPGMVALLSADCLAFPPHEAPLVGTAANRSWHEARVAHFATHLTMSSDEVVGGGALAVERLSYRIKLTPKAGGNPVQDSGACIWVWRRESSGSWKVARAIWNSANPILAVT